MKTERKIFYQKGEPDPTCKSPENVVKIMLNSLGGLELRSGNGVLSISEDTILAIKSIQDPNAQQDIMNKLHDAVRDSNRVTLMRNK